jgi:uncharacterized protein (TIGR02217 family)
MRKKWPGQISNTQLAMTQIHVRAIRKVKQTYNNHQEIDVSGLTVRVIRPNLIDFTWLDDIMFMENTVFPHNISYNSDGAELFSTDVNGSDSGHEQRFSRWEEPLMEYNVAYGVRTMEQLHELKRLFRAVQGQRIGFRFRDPIDYTSSFAIAEEAREPEDITPYDQVIGTGDAVTKDFQLVKSYEYNGQPAMRTIRKPEQGTVVIAANGVQYPDGTYTVDHSTGVVTLGARQTKTVGGTVTMTRVDTTTRTITWDDTSVLAGLIVGDYVQISGFDDVLNRVPESDPWVVQSINDTTKTIKFGVATGSDTSLGVNEAKIGMITITTLEAPPPGWVVTAGYFFHIPVRFTTDRLPIQLETYGVGSANEVKLREIRGDG